MPHVDPGVEINYSWLIAWCATCKFRAIHCSEVVCIVCFTIYVHVKGVSIGFLKDQQHLCHLGMVTTYLAVAPEMSLWLSELVDLGISFIEML